MGEKSLPNTGTTNKPEIVASYQPSLPQFIHQTLTRPSKAAILKNVTGLASKLETTCWSAGLRHKRKNPKCEDTAQTVTGMSASLWQS